jgi:hypothetical protein
VAAWLPGGRQRRISGGPRRRWRGAWRSARRGGLEGEGGVVDCTLVWGNGVAGGSSSGGELGPGAFGPVLCDL